MVFSFNAVSIIEIYTSVILSWISTPTSILTTKISITFCIKCWIKTYTKLTCSHAISRNPNQSYSPNTLITTKYSHGAGRVWVLYMAHNCLHLKVYSIKYFIHIIQVRFTSQLPQILRISLVLALRYSHSMFRLKRK